GTAGPGPRDRPAAGPSTVDDLSRAAAQRGHAEGHSTVAPGLRAVVDRWQAGPVRAGPYLLDEGRCQRKIVSGAARRWQPGARRNRREREANTARSAQSRRGSG